MLALTQRKAVTHGLRNALSLYNSGTTKASDCGFCIKDLDCYYADFANGRVSSRFLPPNKKAAVGDQGGHGGKIRRGAACSRRATTTGPAEAAASSRNIKRFVKNGSTNVRKKQKIIARASAKLPCIATKI